MNIKPIKTKKDYREALDVVSQYFDNIPKKGTEEADHFEILTLLVEDYESKHYPVDPPDAIDAIKFRMEQEGLTVQDLVPSIGQKNRVYEILNGKRSLTLDMIKNLHRNHGISLESLIGI